MNDLTLFPADIANLSVGQLAALPPEQKLEVDRNLDAAIDRLKQARAMSQLPEPPAAPLTVIRLCRWIANAPPGQSLQYHEGLLMRDRAKPGSALPAKACKRLDAVASAAWGACDLDLVHLFSRKVAEYRYQYLAMRSRRAATAAEVRARLLRPTAETLAEVA